jgi:pantoate--beta-alanine ligase
MTVSMQVVTTLAELRAARTQWTASLGLVPTMGALHAGHLSLVRRARAECAHVAVSIFVNPTQFGPQEDLSKYPRDVPRDLAMLEAEGVDLVWTPTPADIYPPNFQTWVEVEGLTLPLEGALRPGHFRGVTTVVAKLFNAFQPEKAFFGQKDAQQAAVIRRMTLDLNFPTEVIICPTVREADGLAMSSRNVYLNPAERQAATVLYRSLSAAKAAHENGERSVAALRQIVTNAFTVEPLVQLQYFSCADYESLQEVEQISGKTLLSLAAFLGKTRLIDNVILE